MISITTKYIRVKPMETNLNNRDTLKTLGTAVLFLAIGGVGTVGAREGASAEKTIVKR